MMAEGPVTFYIGFDPTADSLHIGHYVALMAMAHMQRCGHKPIALLGAGTAMIGDPSGKTDMRKLMTQEQLQYNASCFQKQMERLVKFGDGPTDAVIRNNADWLLPLNYLQFMREIGSLFSVNFCGGATSLNASGLIPVLSGGSGAAAAAAAAGADPLNSFL